MNIFVHSIFVRSSNYLLKMHNYHFKGKGCYFSYVLYLEQ